MIFLNTYYISSGTVPDTIQKYKFGKVLTSYIGNKTCNIGHLQCPYMGQQPLPGKFTLPATSASAQSQRVTICSTWSTELVSGRFITLFSIFLYYETLKCKDLSIIFFSVSFFFPQDGDR